MNRYYVYAILCFIVAGVLTLISTFDTTTGSINERWLSGIGVLICIIGLGFASYAVGHPELDYRKEDTNE